MKFITHHTIHVRLLDQVKNVKCRVTNMGIYTCDDLRSIYAICMCHCPSCPRTWCRKHLFK